MNTPTASERRAVRFGPFLLDLRRRVLVKDGKEVRLGGRAMDLLAALTHRPGELLTREELVRHVWPRTIVEETSLRVHVHALRRALGDTAEPARYISNVPGKGYRFIAPVETGEAGETTTTPPEGNLPFHADAMVGRDGFVADLRARLEAARLVTITGPGGIGKTRVAVAAGHSLLDRFPDGAWFVDLSSLVDPVTLGPAVAAALGVFVHGEDPWPKLEARLEGRRALIVLDNCEHLAAGVAALASNLLSIDGDLRLLATSHTPLHVPGELVVPLPSLDEAEATQLFLERVRPASPELCDDDAALHKVRAICRRLDGMPLALELAAVRAAALGLDAVLERPDDVLEVPGRGRRASPPRHRTLGALLDWSHALLGNGEQIVLRRLSVFRGDFTMDAAVAIASCEHLDGSAVRQCIESLVAKSLVVRADSGVPPSLRLTNITRSYAKDKLASSPELSDCLGRHAHHIGQLHQAQLHAAIKRATAPAGGQDHPAGHP